MRKTAATLALIILALLPLGAVSLRPAPLADSFESLDNLALFDFSDEEGLDEAYLDQVHFYLVTQAPGAPVYSWFGHVGLLVETPDQSVMYDWGVFSFSEGFYLNFLFGRLYYQLLPSHPASSMSQAVREDRRLTILPLDFDNAAKRGAIAFLNYNARPENRTYLYHYYLDNCATRIRDLIDSATGGAFRQWAESVDTGLTLREYSTAYMEHSWPVAFTLNYLQGRSIDGSASLWDACFLPDVLMEAAATFFSQEAQVINEGREIELGDGSIILESFVVGLILAIVMHSLFRRSRRVYGILSIPVHLYFFLLSSVLLFMSLFTNHDVTYGNENLLVLSPLFVIPLIDSIRLAMKPKSRGRVTVACYRIFSILALAALVLKGLFPTVFSQDNFALFAFVAPLYLAMGFAGGKNDV